MTNKSVLEVVQQHVNSEAFFKSVNPGSTHDDWVRHSEWTRLRPEMREMEDQIESLVNDINELKILLADKQIEIERLNKKGE